MSSSAAASGRTSSSTDAFERSVRRWMSAYPRRWRVTFGDDLVATALELAEPGRRRLGLREGLALVRGGWALRRRERPPLRVRVAVALGVGLAEDRRREHRAWLVDRTFDPWADRWFMLLAQVPMVVMLVQSDLRPHGVLAGLFVLAVVSNFVVPLIPAWRRAYGRAAWRRLFPDEPLPREFERPAPSPR